MYRLLRRNGCTHDRQPGHPDTLQSLLWGASAERELALTPGWRSPGAPWLALQSGGRPRTAALRSEQGLTRCPALRPGLCPLSPPWHSLGTCGEQEGMAVGGGVGSPGWQPSPRVLLCSTGGPTSHAGLWLQGRAEVLPSSMELQDRAKFGKTVVPSALNPQGHCPLGSRARSLCLQETGLRASLPLGQVVASTVAAVWQ